MAENYESGPLYRKIPERMKNDDGWITMSLGARGLYASLLLEVELYGLGKVSLKRIAKQNGLDEQEIQRLLDEIPESLLMRDDANGVFWFPETERAMKWFLPNHAKKYLRELRELGDSSLVPKFISAVRERFKVDVNELWQLQDDREKIEPYLPKKPKKASSDSDDEPTVTTSTSKPSVEDGNGVRSTEYGAHGDVHGRVHADAYRMDGDSTALTRTASVRPRDSGNNSHRPTSNAPTPDASDESGFSTDVDLTTFGDIGITDEPDSLRREQERKEQAQRSAAAWPVAADAQGEASVPDLVEHWEMFVNRLGAAKLGMLSIALRHARPVAVTDGVLFLAFAERNDIWTHMVRNGMGQLIPILRERYTHIEDVRLRAEAAHVA